MSKRIKAVIFDLDGTLLDSLADIADSANQVLQQHGLPTHACDDYRYFVGNGVEILMERVVPSNQRDQPGFLQQLVDEMVAVYRENWNNQSALYEGIPEMLTGLVQRDLQIAVLSNKPHASALRCVEYFLADFPIRATLGQSSERPHKPHPAGALEIATRMAVDPAACLFVGDTATDMETAVAAGMYPLGVAWGFRERPELAQAGAQAVIEHPQQLIGFIDPAFSSNSADPPQPN